MVNISLYPEILKKTPRWKLFISMPFIYGMIIPAVIWHICVEIYHQVCFRLYGIELVNSKLYIFLDRHHLKKLSSMQKLNCLYCGYVNGLLAYSAAIASETEKYWCAIKHADKEYLAKRPIHKEFMDQEQFK